MTKSHLNMSTTTYQDDPRITNIGKILRKYKIDEIPQLFNILLGDMSFVGPRPEVEEHVLRYDNKAKIIFKIRPGLTDFSSLYFFQMCNHLKGRNQHQYFIDNILRKKNKLRVFYVRKKSFSVDIYIIWLTVKKVFLYAFTKL